MIFFLLKNHWSLIADEINYPNDLNHLVQQINARNNPTNIIFFCGGGPPLLYSPLKRSQSLCFTTSRNYIMGSQKQSSVAPLSQVLGTQHTLVLFLCDAVNTLRSRGGPFPTVPERWHQRRVKGIAQRRTGRALLQLLRRSSAVPCHLKNTKHTSAPTDWVSQGQGQGQCPLVECRGHSIV